MVVPKEFCIEKYYVYGREISREIHEVIQTPFFISITKEQQLKSCHSCNDHGNAGKMKCKINYHALFPKSEDNTRGVVT